MRRMRTLETTGLLGSVLIVLGLYAGAAGAASTVDVTYDLSDTTLVWDSASFSDVIPVESDAAPPNNGIIAGSMKVRYASDSSSQMPISDGAATLLTFNLTGKSLTFRNFYRGNQLLTTSPALLTGTLHWQLTTPAAGSLTSNGALAGVAANLLMTGRAHCLRTLSFCQAFFGIPDFTIYPSYSLSGAISVAGSAGPYGGAQSTRHTLSGRASAVGWHPGGAFGLGSEVNPDDGDGGVFLVGREIIRSADGHETRVIPEPNTLLLLGSGAAGLGLLGRTTRRARRG